MFLHLCSAGGRLAGHSMQCAGQHVLACWCLSADSRSPLPDNEGAGATALPVWALLCACHVALLVLVVLLDISATVYLHVQLAAQLPLPDARRAWSTPHSPFADTLFTDTHVSCHVPPVMARKGCCRAETWPIHIPQVEAADAEPGNGGTLAAADGPDAQERARKRPRLSEELRYVLRWEHAVCLRRAACLHVGRYRVEGAAERLQRAPLLVHGVLKSYMAVCVQTSLFVCSCEIDCTVPCKHGARSAACPCLCFSKSLHSADRP